MNDRTKLPKWAQQEMDRLERNYEHAKRELRVVLGEDRAGPGSPVVEPYTDAVPLPEGAHVFWPSHGVEVQADSNGFLSIRASKDGALLVQPGSSNVIYVRGAKPHEIKARQA